MLLNELHELPDLHEVAVLYADAGGVYSRIPCLDVWDVKRDARLYAGSLPVVAHPPCERWGRFYAGSPRSVAKGIRLERGADGGCFAAALASVRKNGGVLEHPRDTSAWAAFHIPTPIPGKGWRTLGSRAWTCEVYQGHYGHLSLKPTWLYYCGKQPPFDLLWGKPPGEFLSIGGSGFHSVAERRAAEAAGWRYGGRLPTKMRAATPPEFRAVLLRLALHSQGL